MSKIKNLVIHSDDTSRLKQLADDYRFIGFDVEQLADRLVVFCINRKLKSRKVRMREQKAKQNMKTKRSRTF